MTVWRDGRCIPATDVDPGTRVTVTAPHANEAAYLCASSQVKTRLDAVGTELCGPAGLPSRWDRTGSVCVGHHPHALAALRSVAATSSAPSRTALPRLNRISFSAAAAWSQRSCSAR